ncbi:MAG: type I restriction enzyme HsdR N-terminal domain-containing protein [Vicingaceae bacterium]|nr:type I restriction enzyme HsdR N-terminal domain-containing protein [Vicingaceae bacterium]
MENKWNEICYLIKINKTSAEDLFQSEIVNIFEKLGWSRFNKEIEEKRKIDIGSANSLKPDIIVKNHEKDLFVVELKKPTKKYIERNDSQLFSYFRQLKLNVGLLINDRIHVFYEDGNCRVPVEIMNIEFNDNAQDGLKFIELFSKQSFKLDTLINYCRNQIQSLDAVDYLTSEEYKSKIIEFIKVDACEKFPKDIIDLALKSIEIELTNTIDIMESKNSNNQFIEKIELNTNDLDYKRNEIEKVKRRIPRWLNKPNQTNSKILIKVMEQLSQKDIVSFSVIEKQCENIEKFRGNFEQMANFGAKNHGKIFERDGDNLTLWTPVKDFVKESYLAYIVKK